MDVTDVVDFKTLTSTKSIIRFRKAVRKVMRRCHKNVAQRKARSKPKGSHWIRGAVISWLQGVRKKRKVKLFDQLTARAKKAAYKKREERGKRDLKILAQWLMSLKLPAFGDVSMESMKELVKYFYVTPFQENDIIARQGEHGEAFMILLEGEVSVHIGRCGDKGIGQGIAIYHKLRSFGDDALFRESKVARTSSIMAVSSGCMLVITSQDSQKAMQYMGKAADDILLERKKKITFITKHHLFSGWTDGSLSSFAYCMKSRQPKRNSWLYVRGTKAASVFFLVDGECDLMVPDGPKGVKKQQLRGYLRRGIKKRDSSGYLKLLTLGKGSLIGEEEIMRSKPTRRLAVWCSRDCTFYEVSRYHFNRYFTGNARKRVGNLLESKLNMENTLMSGRQVIDSTNLKHSGKRRTQSTSYLDGFASEKSDRRLSIPPIYAKPSVRSKPSSPRNSHSPKSNHSSTTASPTLTPKYLRSKKMMFAWKEGMEKEYLDSISTSPKAIDTARLNDWPAALNTRQSASVSPIGRSRSLFTGKCVVKSEDLGFVAKITKKYALKRQGVGLRRMSRDQIVKERHRIPSVNRMLKRPERVVESGSATFRAEIVDPSLNSGGLRGSGLRSSRMRARVVRTQVSSTSRQMGFARSRSSLSPLANSALISSSDLGSNRVAQSSRRCVSPNSESGRGRTNNPARTSTTYSSRPTTGRLSARSTIMPIRLAPPSEPIFRSNRSGSSFHQIRSPTPQRSRSTSMSIP
ncbi:hypothetical protein AAMO2058_000632800 [Amorphochlora amoebiformis]